jgi:hypothetical protein
MKKSKNSRPLDRTAFPPGSETALLSGRFGDWVYFVRNGKQCRRRYVRPKDRRSPAQLRVRKNFGEAAKHWSHSPQLTQAQRDAWELEANQIQSRPRLGQSGPLTGQQHFVGRACAKGRVKEECRMMKGESPEQAETRPQAAQGPRLTGSTWEARRTLEGATSQVSGVGCRVSRERRRSCKAVARRGSSAAPKRMCAGSPGHPATGRCIQRVPTVQLRRASHVDGVRLWKLAHYAAVIPPAPGARFEVGRANLEP